MKKIVIMAALAALTAACESKHDRLQKEIETRREALKHHQDSALEASQKSIEQLDQELQRANAAYNRMKAEAETAHANGTATAEQLTRVTQMRMHRDSLQVQFDVLCAKVKYIRKRQAEDEK